MSEKNLKQSEKMLLQRETKISKFVSKYARKKTVKQYLPTSKETSAIESYTHEIVFKWTGIKDSFFQVKGKKRKTK